MGKLSNTSTRQAAQNTKKIRELYGEPIIIPHAPRHFEETPLPSESNPWPLFILIGGTIVAGLCIWRFAPDFLTQIFSAVGW